MAFPAQFVWGAHPWSESGILVSSSTDPPRPSKTCPILHIHWHRNAQFKFKVWIEFETNSVPKKKKAASWSTDLPENIGRLLNYARIINCLQSKHCFLTPCTMERTKCVLVCDEVEFIIPYDYKPGSVAPAHIIMLLLKSPQLTTSTNNEQMSIMHFCWKSSYE